MYILKQYDFDLINFEIIDDKLDGQNCQISNINEEKRYLLPVGLTPTNEGLMSWLKSRIIPKNREFVESFLSKNGLSRKDTRGIIDVCMGVLRKGWRRLQGKVLLYKGGTSGAANAGNEPYSEFFASQIAERMELKHVK